MLESNHSFWFIPQHSKTDYTCNNFILTHQSFTYCRGRKGTPYEWASGSGRKTLFLMSLKRME